MGETSFVLFFIKEPMFLHGLWWLRIHLGPEKDFRIMVGDKTDLRKKG